MTQAEVFLNQIELFLKISGMAPTAFGTKAVGDPNFIRNLRDGRQPTLGMVDRVHEFIRSQEASA